LTVPEAAKRPDGEEVAMPMIQTRGLTKAYDEGGGRTFVLRDIALDVEEGDFLTVMGPSGSGKSTLLHILGMLDAPTSGEYWFAGQPVHRLSERNLSELHKRWIGFVFQRYHLIDELTVYENLETPLLYQKVKTDERKGRVADMLDRFQMVGKKDLFPNQLSGGQQQRVAVARALIVRPKLILADEPTGNLSSKEGTAIMEIFKELNAAGTTIIQVTHSESNAAYGRRLIRLFDGWIEK
jgi:ABC-type lipoprotein export system ATPase subunit